MDKRDLGELKNKLKYLINKKVPIDEITERMGEERYIVYGLIQELINEGQLYDIVDGEIIKLKKPIQTNDVYEIPNNLDKQRLLLISDTHLGNKSDRIDILNYLYNRAEDEGIRTVLHAGDLTDGFYPNRQQQLYELKAIGADEMLDYVINKYPQRTDIKTYFITGNHDATYIRNDGYDMGKAISREREDMIYLGTNVADVKIKNLKIRLWHGQGKQAYAKSYKIQKYIETIPMEERPHMLLTGHVHQSLYMTYQGTHCYQIGALMDSTPFSRQMGMNTERSCWWADTEYNKDDIVKTTNELETFGPKLIKTRRRK